MTSQFTPRRGYSTLSAAACSALFAMAGGLVAGAWSDCALQESRAAARPGGGQGAGDLCYGAVAPGLGVSPSQADAPHFLPFHVSGFSDDPEVFSRPWADADPARWGRAGKIVEKLGGGISARCVFGAKMVAGRSVEGKAVCGTVTHHLLASSLMAEWFRDPAIPSDASTVVIVGPDHFRHARGPAVVSLLPWKTPFGWLWPDEGMGRVLISRAGIVQDEWAFVGEHSVGALVPFVRLAFPRARVLPVLLRRSVAPDFCINLGRVLSELSIGRTFVVASLDFSHGRTSADAREEDRKSVEAMSTMDPSRAWDAFVDSKPALCTTVEFARGERARRFRVVSRSDSSVLAGVPDIPCTSYVNAVFLRDRPVTEKRKP